MNEDYLDLDALSAMVESSPFHQILGLSLESTDAPSDTLVMRLRYDERIALAAGTGQHHGGVIASLIDIAFFILFAAQLAWAMATSTLPVRGFSGSLQLITLTT